jgi:CheY-like chemotaxis protein
MIVVVEDNPHIAELYVAVLADLGHAARAFGDGVSFLDALPALAPDLLILDRRLPGLDALVVASRVRTLRPAVPILMISETAGPAAGAAPAIDRFLATPCTIAQFRGVVSELLAAA